MNDTDFRKKLATLKPVATSVCSKALNSLGVEEGFETEARFGRIDRGRFVPGVTKRQFDEIVGYFTKLGWARKDSNDRVTSRSMNPKQNLRKVEKNGETYYETKERIKIVDVPPNYRLAKSKEKRSAVYKALFDKLSKNRDYVVTRNRITFSKNNIQIDLTDTGKDLQVEIEFKGRKDVCKYIQIVSDMLLDSKRKGAIFSQYKNLLGPKFAGPLPQTLTLEAFKKRTLTRRNYSVTEKADGERYLLFVDSEGGMSLISRNMDIALLKDLPTKPDFANTVMDGELYKNKFYTFDILAINGNDLRKQKLPDRLMNLYQVLVAMRVPMLRMKNFLVDTGRDIIEYPSQKVTGFKNIYEASAKIWGRKKNFPYPLDGLIFTPTDDGYFSRDILKWKDENTIDFYYKGNRLHLAGFDGNGKNYMNIPFSGIDGKGTFNTRTKLVKNEIFTDNTASKEVREGKLSKPIPGDPGVGEFKFEDNTFRLIRKRPDRQFGNGVLASNQVWESITNPITIKELSAGPGAMRDFHSEIKSKLIMKYAKGKSVVDIGSGKGEDVGKYVKAGSKPVVGFDIVEEEYPHPEYMTFYRVDGPVYSVKNYTKGQKFDVMNINFAIHYFFKNKKLFESLVMNIHESLKKGGVLMATVLDGRLIYEALKGKNKLSTNRYTINKKYSNSLNFNSQKFKMLGQQVDVLVKGTKYFNRPIAEYLFNFEKFLKIMEQLGFELVETGNFKEFCSESEWCRRYMTDAEKDYSFKNIYFVLRKK